MLPELSDSEKEDDPSPAINASAVNDEKVDDPDDPDERDDHNR